MSQGISLWPAFSLYLEEKELGPLPLTCQDKIHHLSIKTVFKLVQTLEGSHCSRSWPFWLCSSLAHSMHTFPVSSFAQQLPRSMKSWSGLREKVAFFMFWIIFTPGLPGIYTWTCVSISFVIETVICICLVQLKNTREKGHAIPSKSFRFICLQK